MVAIITMEEKASTSRVKRSSGSYTFRIEGYSGLSNRVGDSTESPEFDLCGHTWQLRIFPGGSLDAHKGYLSFYLASKSLRVARASYKLILSCQLPGGNDEIFASSGVRLFEAKGVQIDGWGRDKFISNTAVFNPEFGFLVDDTIMFKVEITVFGDLEVVPNVLKSNQLQPLSLSKSLKALIDQDIITDIEIDFQGQEEMKLRAHKCILSARSPVFHAMLSHPMLESTTGCIHMDDVEYDIMKEILSFMYTDEFTDLNSLLETKCESLLAAACKYQILGIMIRCEEYLIHQITLDTVISLLRISDTYQLLKLKEHTTNFIAHHSESILQSKDFSELDATLRKEAEIAIENANKRKGCRGLYSADTPVHERRFATSCVIS